MDYHTALKQNKTKQITQKNKETLYVQITQNNEQGAECYHLCIKEGKKRKHVFVYICAIRLWKNTQKPVRAVAYLGKKMD